MAFQWVFDKAAQIAVNNRAVVAQTVTRNQTVRAVSRGNGIYKFTITMPEALPWDQYADEIALLDAANMFTVENVQFSNTGYTNWLHNGDLTGQNWDVICVEMPTWVITDINTVRWSGDFVFFESVAQ